MHGAFMFLLTTTVARRDLSPNTIYEFSDFGILGFYCAFGLELKWKPFIAIYDLHVSLFIYWIPEICLPCLIIVSVFGLGHWTESKINRWKGKCKNIWKIIFLSHISSWFHRIFLSYILLCLIYFYHIFYNSISATPQEPRIDTKWLIIVFLYINKSSRCQIHVHMSAISIRLTRCVLSSTHKYIYQ